MGTAVKGVLAQARRAAQRRSQRPSTGYLLLVMVQGSGPASEILAAHGVRETDLLSALRVVDEEPRSAVELAVERAEKLARVLGEEVSSLHLLAAIARDSRTAAYGCLERLGGSVAGVRDDAMTRLGVLPPTQMPAVRETAPRQPPRPVGPGPTAVRRPTPPRRSPRPARSEVPDPSALASERSWVTRPKEGAGGTPSALADEGPPRGPARPNRKHRRRSSPPSESPENEWALDGRRYPTLAALGRNLTEIAAAGGLDPVIGREREVELLLDVLARRRSNNPMLVGPPGVGKTAVVEELARRLVSGGTGVCGLGDRIIVELSAGALVSGTAVRGALAERLKLLREEVGRSEGRIVLFIDEIHAIAGGDGPDDLANELKSALARGELPCIGATTEAEYRKHFERDAALARRFSPIHVEEPTPKEAVAIISGLVGKYEAHHGVRYEPQALEAAVELGVRYLTERHLPDKALGVVDLAGARTRRQGGAMVDRAAVARVVAEQARVPVERLLMRDVERLLSLEELVAERVVGHRDAVTRVADALRKGAAGFRGKRPLGTFLLLGPTGVGKTEMAKAIGDLLFGAGAMSRFDMSEFSESHAVARLLGAPPGYVGHDEGGQLTEAVRRRPYQLLLLDEIEKAHPEVLLALLPLLDEGRLTDARGRTVDFTNTVIFMTSNLGARARSEAPKIGFGSAPISAGEGADGKRAMLSAARSALPPELWNRIDEPLVFAPLGRDEVACIARRLLDEVAAQVRREQGVELVVDASTVDALVEAGGYDPELGARPMKRTIGRLVESPLAALLLRNAVSRGSALRLSGRGDRVVIDEAGPAEASGVEAAE
jgi:ATP-dependent Clp protease ATP-binding subunit ClpC